MLRKNVLCSILITTLIIATSGTADAASRKLTKNKSLNVKSKFCVLGVTAESTSLVTINCVGEKTSKKTPESTDKTVFLKPSKSVNIKSKSCFLAVQSTAEKIIKVKCLTTAPTATPTATSTPSPTSTPNVTPNATMLLNSNLIVPFAKATPEFPKSAQDLTGVVTGDIIVSIDRRPQNNRLYGLGYNSTAGTVRLYCINEETSTATAVGTPTSNFVNESAAEVRIGLNASTSIEMDFNPAADRLRVVTGNGQNFRMNPNTGDFIDGDLGGSVLTGVNMDGLIHGSTSTLAGAAYTNNKTNVAVTTLYTTDNFTKGVFIQNPPNSGTQTGSNILDQSPISVTGFDIGEDATATSNNTAVTSGTGHFFAQKTFGGPQLYCTFNLANTTFGNCSQIGSYTSGILGLALNDASDVSLIGLNVAGNSIVRFKSLTTGTSTNVSATGVNAGESLVGIDFRPSTGQLFALGINATNDTGTLYILDPQNGVATAVGSAGSITFAGVDFPDPSTSSYAVNFNPAVDRVRVITSSGLNFRINPNNGATAANDAAINGLGAVVNGASYTNSFGGATATTLYTIDSVNSAIYIQSPPNAGTQTAKIPLVFSTPTTFTSILGFEVQSGAKVSTNDSALTAGAPRSAYAVLTSGGTPRLYLIDLVTGNATLLGAMNTQLRTLAATIDNASH